MADDIFLANIKRRFIDITVQVKHASKKGISNQAKSGYYRFAILLACTISEGLLFRIIRQYLDKNGGNMGLATKYKEPHHIPPKYHNGNVVLCIQEKLPILLSNQTKFSELIKFAHDKKVISNGENTNLEKVMRLRNRIHVQSLERRDNGYTKKKLDEIFNSINELVKIYNQ
jgi:hypothetical protein